MTAALRTWVKSRNSPLADRIFRAAKFCRGVSFPVIPGVHRGLYELHRVGVNIGSTVLRTLWYTPLFQSRLERPAFGLYCYSGMPLILGDVKLQFGRHVRISGQTTISGRSGSDTTRLVVGDNVDIGWQTTIAVGRNVRIGNNVRIAGRAFLAGYPGHPIDAEARAAGAPDTPDQVGDIILEDDVWLATGVTVSSGVRIGRGSIIGAGSVVTKDIPAGVMVGGVPARVLKVIANQDPSS